MPLFFADPEFKREISSVFDSEKSVRPGSNVELYMSRT